jgi:hypothetical protein
VFEHYVGLDLHQACFRACAETVTGDRVSEDRFPKTDAGTAAFLQRCNRGIAVAVEASTPTWHCADAMCGRVGSLRIFDPVKVKLEGGLGGEN